MKKLTFLCGTIGVFLLSQAYGVGPVIQVPECWSGKYGTECAKIVSGEIDCSTVDLVTPQPSTLYKNGVQTTSYKGVQWPDCGVTELANCKCAWVQTHTCIKGYYGNPTAAGIGCTKCGDNATTSGTGTTIKTGCLCVAGYYGTNGDCTECPSPGTSKIGIKNIEECYIPEGNVGSDATGTFEYKSHCPLCQNGATWIPQLNGCIIEM